MAGKQDALPLFQLGQPRWPEALTHYYFAAAGNDSFARMVLGYRHMHGLGVPKSCQTAVLYYQPVAEQVVDLARKPGSLPYVCHTHPQVPLGYGSPILFMTGIITLAVQFSECTFLGWQQWVQGC
jgi:hypothetical protein